MIIIYKPSDGEILFAVLEKDILTFSHNVDAVTDTIEIDEIEENKDIITSLIRDIWKADINGLKRFYIENGELYERDGWEEAGT